MQGPEAGEDIRRCPSCGALVSAEATWCGQCFAPLKRSGREQEFAQGLSAEADPAPVPPETGAVAAAPPGRPTAAPTWPCPVCGNDNAIELDVCSVCGTPFATLMRMDDRPPPIDPREALTASLIYPGRGHRKVGRTPDGIARGVLFAVLFALTVLLASSGLHSMALVGAFLLYASLTLLVYVGSALEAYRLAQGGEVFVASRTLLWATVAVIMATMGLIALSLIGAVRR
jgi:hypothetical protein